MKQGWEIKRLDDACEVEYGTRVVQKRDGGTVYPVYGGGGATFFMDTFNREDCLVVARFAMSAQCTRFVEGKFFLNDSGLTVSPKNDKELLPEFLNLQMFFLNDHIYSLSRGTAQRNLDVPAFRNIQIAYPKSLPEQQRIVSILDECFAAIDKTKANAEQNLKNAKELFESYLQGVFEKKGDGWEEKKLGEVFEIKPPKKEAKEKLSDNDLVSFLPMEDLGVCENEIKPTKEKPLKDVASSYTYFAENDVLLAKITPCFENGKLGVAKNLTNGIGFGSSEYIVFRCPDFLVPEFFFYFLSRASLREEGKKYMSGAVGHKRVSKDWIENYIFSFPKSIEAQQTIVRQLDALRAETQKLEAVYQQKIADLNELKKIHLAKSLCRGVESG